MGKRHARTNFYIKHRGMMRFETRIGAPKVTAATDKEMEREFQFSQMGPLGPLIDLEEARELLVRIAFAMTPAATLSQPDSENIPAGFTYLGQFIDHDLTKDVTENTLGSQVTLSSLMQGRSPALDLDSLYGRGPTHPEDATFFSDGVRFILGQTMPAPDVPGLPPFAANFPLDGFDLPRANSSGQSLPERRQALIPDLRNDENLAIAQTHLGFMRFHNRVVEHLAGLGTPSALLFEKARESVVKHYQWMIKTDYLPRLVEPSIVDDVFQNGRKFFEANGGNDAPTMPIEFSMAAFRFGHSMVRDAYEWNRVFKTGGGIGNGTMGLLFNFSGTSGALNPTGDQTNPDSLRLPTNWIVDFRRLYNFTEALRPDLAVSPAEFNVAKKIDTLLVDPLIHLPLGSFGNRDAALPPVEELNLAFRNLMRGAMARLATGQQMASMMSINPLTPDQVMTGSGGGAVLAGDAAIEAAGVAANTPLWFYILREAELNNGKLNGVGARIVVETFHRAMEGSRHSIIRDPGWRPSLGRLDPGTQLRDENVFHMVDLLLFAFEGRTELLNPLS
jgi:hypothetical protein